MNHFQRAVIGVAVAAIAAGAWVFKYDVVPVDRGGDGSSIDGYQLDRWTGKIKALVGDVYLPVIEDRPEP